MDKEILKKNIAAHGEYIEDNDVVIDIYDELCDTDLVKEIE